MGNLGGGEILVIFLVALIVLGPTKLPDAARQAGRAMQQLRQMTNGFREEFRNAVDDLDLENQARERGRERSVTPPAPPAELDEAPPATPTVVDEAPPAPTAELDEAPPATPTVVDEALPANGARPVDDGSAGTESSASPGAGPDDNASDT